MVTSTVEDYLKAILLHEQAAQSDQLVSMGQISSALGVAPGTVTAMMKSLERADHLTYSPYSGVRLTASGRQLALHVVRRHRLIELFLVEVLGLDWSEVHEEAERLEHAMSERLIDRIDQLLGYPTADPHGDPIPDARGTLRPSPRSSLADCALGELVRIVRVGDQAQAFLRLVDRHGLKPGSRAVVIERDAAADVVVVRPASAGPDDHQADITLGREAAAKLWVEPAGQPQHLEGAFP